MSLERLTEPEENYIWTFCVACQISPDEFFLAWSDTAKNKYVGLGERAFALMLERHGCLDSSL